MLLTTLYAITTDERERADAGVYEQIPFNMKLGCDHIIRNATLQSHNQTAPIHVDVGINFETRRNGSTGSLEQIATVAEIGDLRTFTALEEDADAHGAALNANLIELDHSFSANEFPLLLKQL